MSRSKSKFYSINYEKVFGKQIKARPIKIKLLKLKKERLIEAKKLRLLELKKKKGFN